MFGPQCISFIRLQKALFQGLGESWENRVRGRKLNGMPVNHCAPQIRNHTPRSSLAVQVHLPACFWEKTPYRRGEYVKLHTELLIESLDRPWSCEGQRCTTAPPKDKLKRGLVFHIVSHNPSYTHPLSLSLCGLLLLTDLVCENINYLSRSLFLLNSYQKGKQRRAEVRGIIFKLFISNSSPAAVFNRGWPV